ncbi:prominin-like protein [Hyposmocoma kahamanoa]|uniref:prominin-like protein n=1 Tax=Hyposmocoma kahamanoa TaxID=1477025 RepID=UPI000E6D7812|nr:prominin-like protein [Hyposmocoma kahamanoa]
MRSGGGLRRLALLVPVAVMLGGWASSADAAESFLTSISRNLRAEMSGVLEMAVVNYSKPVLNATYTATVEFDMRAMGPIYNSTHIVVDAIAHKDAYPEGLIVVSDGFVELNGSLRDDWRTLLAHYAGPVAIVVVAALLAAILPLAGLFWCCCYWCRAGRRRRPFDRKYDSCIKALLAILLIGLLTLFLYVYFQIGQMPDVSELLSNVTALLESNIKAEVEDGQQVFRNIQREIQRSIDEDIPSVQEQISNTGRRLEGVADQITYLAGNASVKLKQQSAAADTLQQLYEQYGPYRMYATRATAAALLTILVVLAWGLMCGVCGKRPDVYGASDCCNKGAGSSALLCGMGLMFVLGGVVSLVLLVYFLVGVAGTRFVCDPLTEPRGNRLFADVEKFVDLERALFNERSDSDFNLTSVMLRCHNNGSIYEVFQLHRLYDLQAVKAEMSAEVERRVAQLRPAYAPAARATILRDSAKRKLRLLADTGLSDFDFDRILQALETNMTSLALDSLSAQLDSTGRSLQARPGFEAVAVQLRNASQRLSAYHADIVTPMLRDAAALNATAARLRDTLRFNHSSLKEAIAYLLDETAQAENFLNTQGPDLIQNMTREFAEVVATMLEEYLERVVVAANQEVGRCGPLSSAFNATRDAHCHKILMPVNGYWMALSWCVLLFVPVMVVAQRLARLYLHVDPYPGPLVEAEYLYDAYADRDNVPLANAYKAEKRTSREARRGGSSAGGGGEARGERRQGATPAVAAPLDAHHARRYNDMAPKHWEEGPPRYHGPTEYERPPPYYYPGPTDRQ